LEGGEVGEKGKGVARRTGGGEEKKKKATLFTAPIGGGKKLNTINNPNCWFCCFWGLA